MGDRRCWQCGHLHQTGGGPAGYEACIELALVRIGQGCAGARCAVCGHLEVGVPFEWRPCAVRTYDVYLDESSATCAVEALAQPRNSTELDVEIGPAMVRTVPSLEWVQTNPRHGPRQFGGRSCNVFSRCPRFGQRSPDVRSKPRQTPSKPAPAR